MTPSELERLASNVERHTLVDGAHETAVPDLMLYRASAQTSLSAVVYEPSLCVVAQGAKEVLLGGEAYRYDPAHSLLVSVDLPVDTRVVKASPGRPCLVAVLSLDMAVVGEFLADGMTDSPPRSPFRGLDVSPIDEPLRESVARLVALLNTPQHVGPLSPLMLREITYRLLTGPHGPRLRQIASAGAAANRIARAIRWLKDNFADPLRIESLAQHVRMSPSALHLHFKSVTAMSPLQYQKRLRLQEARRLMLGEGLSAGEAAFRVGYESPSQFGREYRRQFGSRPTRTWLRSSSKLSRRVGAPTNESISQPGHLSPCASSLTYRSPAVMPYNRMA